MLTKKQINFFNNNGYVKVKIFKKNKLDKFKHELAKLIKVSLKVNFKVNIEVDFNIDFAVNFKVNCAFIVKVDFKKS